jgi:hypothetical protein
MLAEINLLGSKITVPNPYLNYSKILTSSFQVTPQSQEAASAAIKQQATLAVQSVFFNVLSRKD